MIEALRRKFFASINFGEGGCVLWTKACSEKGYGKLMFEGRCLRAHRVSWYLKHGVWPDLHVLHTCDNPPCVNPDHLFLGSRSDNMRDCASKCRGATVGKSRLTHCVHGHEFTAGNTRVDKLGHRRCRTCEAARSKARIAAAIRARGETSHE